jgi:hypothetical protein
MKNLFSQAQALNEQVQALEPEYADLIYYSSLNCKEIAEINFFNNQKNINNEK